MKRFLPSLVFVLCSVSVSFAQAPKGINYQGVARDNEGKALVSTAVSVRISILKNSATGEVEYAETHKPQTNQFGLFTLVIGQGTKVTGDFVFISWAVGSKWLQIEIDPKGGSSYTLTGSQQLMTVPYAFYAEYAGNGSSLNAGTGIAINNGVVSNTGDADNDSNNELQNLSEVLTKSNNAGGIKITNMGAPVDGADAATKNYVDTKFAADLDIDPTNELQNLAQALTRGNDAGAQKITNLGAPTVATDAATKSYVDTQNALDLDKSATNEIQDLALNTTTNILNITNNTSATSINLTPYKQTLTYTPATNNLAISGGNNVTISSTLTQVLTNSGVGGAGGLRIQNVGAPTTNTDATTKLYVDNALATTYAFKVPYSFTNPGGSVTNQVVNFSADTYDDFNVTTANRFVAPSNGIYMFFVDGTVNNNNVILSIRVNSTTVFKVKNSEERIGLSVFINHSLSLMLKLNQNDFVELVITSNTPGDNVVGSLFGYKL